MKISFTEVQFLISSLNGEGENNQKSFPFFAEGGKIYVTRQCDNKLNFSANLFPPTIGNSNKISPRKKR